jgi:hypothetical protein
MKNILHFIFALTIILFMILMLVPSIMIYMFTRHNIIQEIQTEAAKLERKYFS